jgi:hypothetical protein
MLLLLLILLPLVAPSPANAAPRTAKKAIWGPISVDGKSQFPIYKDLGVGIFQWPVRWHAIATRRPADPRNPADPAYQWPDLDGMLDEARRSGIKVLLEVQGTPSWANGGRDPQWAARRTSDVADFMTAISRRYPGVRYWQVWNEPTRRDRFRPMAIERRGRPLTRKQQKGPRRYARILDSSYAALKAVDRGDKVIGGNTFTTGAISPRNFIRYMRLPSGQPPRMDLYGHNPFTARRPDFSRPPLGYGLADFSDLDTVNRWVRRHLGRGGHKPRLYLSEFFTPTDHHNHEFNFYVSKKVQARWLRDAMRITRRHRFIHTLGVFLLDDPPQADGREVNRGIMTHDGRRKPAYRAFRDG